MKRLASIGLAVAGLALAPSAAASESSIQCEGGIVSVGDSTLDVLAKCGRPTLVDERLDESSFGSGLVATVAVEQWTYDFGPNRFLRFVTLVAGRVVGIERGGYGYAPQSIRGSDRARCEPGALRVGDRTLDLLAKCGEPTLRASALERRGDGDAWVAVQVEVWTYDLGPQSFIRIVTLENGQVVRVERGGYGYAR
jgi:hypothetical protein